MAAPKLNVIAIAGRLTRDAEMRNFSSGGCVVSFDIGFTESVYLEKATNKWKYKNGFITVKMFFKDQDRAGRYAELCKTMHVVIKGKLGFEQWEKDGVKKSKLVIVADSIEGINVESTSGRAAGGNSGYGGQRRGASRYDAPAPDDNDGQWQSDQDSNKDDIPF